MEEVVGTELDFIRKDLNTAALPPQNFDDIINETLRTPGTTQFSVGLTSLQILPLWTLMTSRQGIFLPGITKTIGMSELTIKGAGMEDTNWGDQINPVTGSNMFPGSRI